MSRRPIKAVIPVAGLGTRWHPWSRIVPKELIPIGARPALHFTLDEVCAAGIREIGIVTRTGKDLLRAYVDEVWRCQKCYVNISWFSQARPLGVGDAVLAAKDWAGSDPLAVLYPDELHPSSGGLQKLVAAFDRHPALWLGLAPRCAGRRQSRYQLEPSRVDFRVIGRSMQENESVVYGTGRYILPNGLAGINDNRRRSADAEFDDDELLDFYGFENAWALQLPDPIHDVGCPDNWRRALADILSERASNQ